MIILTPAQRLTSFEKMLINEQATEYVSDYVVGNGKQGEFVSFSEKLSTGRINGVRVTETDEDGETFEHEAFVHRMTCTCCGERSVVILFDQDGVFCPSCLAHFDEYITD